MHLFFSIPGGHLENGETFEEAAIKEVFEETGLRIKDPKVFCVTNNLRTYTTENKHYVSVNLFVENFEGTPKAMEPVLFILLIDNPPIVSYADLLVSFLVLLFKI